MAKKLQREVEPILAKLPRKFAKDLIREKLVETGMETEETLMEQSPPVPRTPLNETRFSNLCSSTRLLNGLTRVPVSPLTF